MARGRRYFHGGAVSMVVLATLLAVVASFVATLVYARVDAGRKLPTNPTASAATADPEPTAPRATDDTPTTLKVPQDLSPDDLAKKVAASVRAVITLDEAGQRVQGTAFVVGSFGGQTLLLTSFAVVRASTRAPGPGISLDGGQQATLWTWQEDRDLALLVIPGAVESLPWASAAPKQGEKLYAGGAGQKLSVGVVLASIDGGLEHNIFVDDIRQGAPLVNQKGEVIAMASKVYNPNGKGTDSLFIGIPIRMACDRVLRCGSGNTGPGEAAATTTTAKP